MDLTQYVIATATLIGFVNGVKLAIDHNWNSFGLFAVSVLGGTLFGFLHWFMLPSPEVGFALGIAASGTYEVAQRAGGK